MEEKRVPRIGVVVAVELDAVLRKYGEAEALEKTRGYDVRVYRNASFELFVVHSGAGEIAAASSTQFLIDRYEVDMILNFGVVGALTEKMGTTEICVVEKVIHYDFDTAGWNGYAVGHYMGYDSPWLYTSRDLLDKVKELEPDLPLVACASADKFVDAPEKKMELHELYGADICEMEAAGIVLTCHRNSVPILSVKAVSDSLTGGAKEFGRELDRVSSLCFEMVDRLLHRIYG